MAPIVERMPVVLVVDDDANIRFALADVLRDERYVVATANDGAEAIALLRAGLRPATILLDLWMPVLDGVAALAQMKADPDLQDIPVIVMTAHPEAKNDVMDQIAAFLAKPLELDALLDAVATCALPRWQMARDA